MNNDITQVMNSLKREEVAPIYLLQGSDKYLQRLISEKIADTFFGDGKKDKSLLIPSDTNSQKIVDELLATDLFSSKRMFVLLNPQKISGQSRKDFLAYCDNPVESNCLVIVLEEFGKQTAMVRELTKRFTPVNISSPFENEMRKWVQYFLREKGIKANSAVLNTIIEIAGDSVSHIANEIDKISILLNESQELTEELVRQFSGWKREHQRWEFFKALGNKNLEQSIKTGLSLLKQNEDMFSLTYPLTTFFQELLFAKLSSDYTPGRGGYVPLSNSVTKNLPQTAKRYSRAEVELAIKLLGEIDERLKTVNPNHQSELTKFLFGLLGDK